MDVVRWKRDFRRGWGWLRSAPLAALIFMGSCPYDCDPDSFDPLDPFAHFDAIYGPVGKSIPVELSRQAIGAPGGPLPDVLNADLIAAKDGVCFDFWRIGSEFAELYDIDPSSEPAVKGVILQSPRTRPTDDPYLDEIVTEYAAQPIGGWRSFTLTGAPLTQTGDVATTYGAIDYSGSLADAARERPGTVYVPSCSSPPPPVAVVTKFTDSGTTGSSTDRLPFGLVEGSEVTGIVFGGQYGITDVQMQTRARDEEIERWIEEAYRRLDFGSPRFESWIGTRGEDRYSIMVTETRTDGIVAPPPAFYAPPPPPAGTGGLVEQFYATYGFMRRQVDDVLEEGRSSCDYENGEGIITSVAKTDVASAAREGRGVNLEVERTSERRPICGELPIAGSLFRGGSTTRGRMQVDVTGAGDEGMAQVPLDVLVDAGKVRERRDDGRRDEPVVVEIDRTDSDGEVTVPVDEFDVPEGTETVAFELNRTRNGLRERRIVLVPLTDDMTDEDAEDRVRDRYPGWEITWFDGYLEWGAGEWYSLDLVRRRIQWTGLGIWGDLRRQAYLEYLYRTLSGRRGLVVVDDLRLMLIQAWLLNPFGWPTARTIPGFQQKIAFLNYYYTGDEVRLPGGSRDAPGGGSRGPRTPPDGMPEVYLVDRGESTGESMEMIVVNGNGRPIRFSGAVVVEPVELGPEERRRLEGALRNGEGRRVTVEAYCLQRDLGVPAEGTVMRIASRSMQQRFAVERRILFTAHKVRDGGGLHPNTSPESYFHSVLQWALWTRENGYDRREFEDAFVEHARENFAQAGRAWNEEVERAVRALVPARWDDVQRILEDAES